MRKMKKMAALCMAGMMAPSLAACSGGAKETTAAAPAETQAETAAQTTAEEKSPGNHIRSFLRFCFSGRICKTGAWSDL